jgi:hypothetical protein
MGADTRGILCGRWRAWTGEGLDSTKVRELQWAVKVDEEADAIKWSRRHAVVGRRRSAGISLSKQGQCGAQTAWAFAAGEE